MTKTVRMTVAQAAINFLGAQHSESDGVEQKLFAGCLGIFGHGNVAGIGQALLQAELEEPELLPYVLGRSDQRRTRGDQHADGRGARHDQPAARAAAAGGHVRGPLGLAAAAGAGAAVRR
jgi:TPP-dependent trihydroxycyclohexane-1,2-dione (THcHDO) dehydratase